MINQGFSSDTRGKGENGSFTEDQINISKLSDVGEDLASSEREPHAGHTDLLYGVEDNPPWYLCILFGLQHFLTALPGDLAQTLAIFGPLCLQIPERQDRLGTIQAEIFSTILFMSGISTVLQATFGVRLPIVQGVTASYLAVNMNYLQTQFPACEDMACPPDDQQTAMSSVTVNTTDYSQCDYIHEERIRQLSGTIIVGSIFEMFLGITGAAGFLLRFIGPLTIAPTIMLIGLSLMNVTIRSCETYWWMALGTLLLIMIFSLFLSQFNVPVFVIKRNGKRYVIRYPVFKTLSVFLAVVTAWILTVILTETGVFNDNYADAARSDKLTQIISDSKWFKFPLPLQFGAPVFTTSAVLGIMAATLVIVIESVGDYKVCARMGGVPQPPEHAVNRGIFMEGLSIVLCGIWGCCHGLTSYSNNVAVIGLTKVGSRRMIQACGVILFLLGMLTKFSAFFVTIPTPVVGGVLLSLVGMLTAIGMSNLQSVDLNSSRNLFILGVSLFMGLVMPAWVSQNKDDIDVGVDVLNQTFIVLLSTGMFVGGVTAFTLDNLAPGTRKERGMTEHKLGSDQSSDQEERLRQTYDIPLIGRFLHGACCAFVPIFPDYKSCSCCTGSDDTTDQDSVHETRI